MAQEEGRADQYCADKERKANLQGRWFWEVDERNVHIIEETDCYCMVQCGVRSESMCN